MTVSLRLVLDQVVSATDPDLATASAELATALIAATPAGCDVEAIVPASTAEALEALTDDIPGLARVTRSPLPRRELAAAWQMGVTSGLAGGMMHSPTLLAPLNRHDRAHDQDQRVVTLWDLRAWEQPDELPRAQVAFQKTMLKRAAKHADALVVPTHAMAERVVEIAPKLGGRVRVISGAAPAGLRAPNDAAARMRELGLPNEFVVIAAGPAVSEGLADGLRAVTSAASAGSDVAAVVTGASDAEEAQIVDLAEAAGMPAHRLHVLPTMAGIDRAALLSSASALLAPAVGMAYPWRVLEALALGVPVVAASSAAHLEVIADGGVVAAADADGLGDALATVLTASDTKRARVLAHDRSRAFSWSAAAERVWHLHADL